MLTPQLTLNLNGSHEARRLWDSIPARCREQVSEHYTRLIGTITKVPTLPRSSQGTSTTRSSSTRSVSSRWRAVIASGLPWSQGTSVTTCRRTSVGS